MPVQAPPTNPPPTISAACVLEGAAKSLPFDQLPEAIRADVKRRLPDLWIPGPVFDPSPLGASWRFVVAARLDARYVVAYEHDGWSAHTTLLAYDTSVDVTPKADWSFEEKPSCERLAWALKAPLYPRKP